MYLLIYFVTIAIYRQTLDSRTAYLLKSLLIPLVLDSKDANNISVLI